jgi:hypothetical protein
VQEWKLVIKERDGSQKAFETQAKSIISRSQGVPGVFFSFEGAVLIRRWPVRGRACRSKGNCWQMTASAGSFMVPTPGQSGFTLIGALKTCRNAGKLAPLRKQADTSDDVDLAARSRKVRSLLRASVDGKSSFYLSVSL